MQTSPLACVFASALAVASVVPSRASAQAPLERIITRQGDQLMDGDRPFRFISFNIPNLQLVEDNFAPGAKTAWRWPDEFELNDALESVRQLGGTVVRTYVLSVRRKGSDMGDHVYVRGPGDFNEEAFCSLDLALEIAGKKGVRIVIPLVDGWKWQGGRAEYAAFRGKRPDDFWTDEQVIADFEATIRHVLTRVNTRTGVAYRDDPAILAWETGNEVDCPSAWTRRIAATIKSLDAKHLVLDGGSWRRVQPESLDDPNVDVVATHHYPNLDGGSDYVPGILAAREASKGKRPYFVGEFGFAPAEQFERVYDAVIENDVSGALLWSLRFHSRDGGFYWHWEPAGGGLFKAYHWPGFPSGDKYDERATLELTRRKAFEIRGVEPPAIEPPAPPKLLAIADAADISWQGRAGARSYAVERAPAADGPWKSLGKDIDDTAVQFRPLFHDDSAEPGQSYYYRVLARNDAGSSSPSEARGPVSVSCRTLIDECRDLSLTQSHVGEVRATTGNDRRRREDMHRLSIPAHGAVVYKVDESIARWKASAFLISNASEVRASYSRDGAEFSLANVNRFATAAGEGDYDYLPQVTITSTEVSPDTRFLRLEAVGDGVELSWAEIHYDEK
jgi:mannan endo-1,4-beta-mannosidase